MRHIKMVAAGLGLEAGGPVGGDAVAEAAVGPMKAAGLAGFLRKLAVCPDTVISTPVSVSSMCRHVHLFSLDIL